MGCVSFLERLDTFYTYWRGGFLTNQSIRFFFSFCVRRVLRGAVTRLLIRPFRMFPAEQQVYRYKSRVTHDASSRCSKLYFSRSRQGQKLFFGFSRFSCLHIDTLPEYFIAIVFRSRITNARGNVWSVYKCEWMNISHLTTWNIGMNK